MNPALKSAFQLDPEVIFLNHGSFGACPGPVMKTYQEWQLRLEKQPVQFLARELPDLLEGARQSLADALGCGKDNLVYISNATFGVNTVARSLDLGPGDEILTTDQEYGACLNAWKHLCGKTGAGLVQVPLSLPIRSKEAVLKELWKEITSRTRLIFLSHITSPTAQHLPVKAVCTRAREEGILTLVDGAHAPGQLQLDLTDIGADFYTGNCHKWLLSPKGAAFLYVRPDLHRLIEPLVVSWGWGANPAYDSGSRLVNLLEWQGTRDPSAALSVPAALSFQEQHRWAEVRKTCREALQGALAEIENLTGLPSLYREQTMVPPQMAAAALPTLDNPSAYQATLYREHRIEIPVLTWHGKHLLRLSVQAYNQTSDLEALLDALAGSLDSFTSG